MDFSNASSPVGMTIVIGLCTLLLFIWTYKKRSSYWKDRGVPYVKSYPFIGVWLERFFGEPLHEILNKRYFSMPSVYGFFEGNLPALSVADPRLLRDIFVKDFQVFPNRRLFVANDKIADHSLAFLDGEEWKRVRSAVSPTFSTGKLKNIIIHFKDCAKAMTENFKQYSVKQKPVNIKKIYNSFLMDATASSLFSTKVDSHNGPDNKFTKLAGRSVVWRFALFACFPSFMKFFKINVFDPVSRQFFWDTITQIIEERKGKKQTWNDFLQILLDTVETKGDKEVEDSVTSTDKDLINNYKQENTVQRVLTQKSKKSMSINEVVSQCASFFRAGFDTSEIVLSLASYFLALNKDVQNKAREEIEDCLRETKGELTYEALQNMEYIDNIISETMRIYPPAIRTERRAGADYKFRDTDITIEKGTLVTIPIYSIQRDPKYYPDPERFDPERFTKEGRSKRDPYVFLPFGAGPRNCVGMRFALMEIKVALVYVITCFNVKICHQTQIPLQFNKGYEFLQLKDIYLMMEPRQECKLNLH